MKHRHSLVVLMLVAAIGGAGACADSTVVGSEQPDGGTGIVPPAEGGAAEDATAPANDAAPDVDSGTPLCSKDGFCPTDLPKSEHLVSIWGDGDGVVWTVSTEGDILRWDGSAWTIHHRVKGTGFAVWGSGPGDVWVATSAGLLHGVGASPPALVFTPVNDVPGDPAVPILGIWGTGPNDIWFVGGLQDWEQWPPFLGRAVHFGGDTASGGTGWTSDDELAALGIEFENIWGSPGTGVWVAGLGMDEEWQSSFLRVYRRAPGADGWVHVVLPGPHDYATELLGAGLGSETTVMISGVSGVTDETNRATWLGTSDDNGQTFSWTYTPQIWWKRDFLAYWGTAPNDSWGVGTNGLVSHWNGTTWTQAVLQVTGVPVGKALRAIWGTSSDDFWVVGDEIALHKTNAGKP
jgi:hypothetical protein